MQAMDSSIRRQRNTEASRIKRFHTHFTRWQRGEPIRTYDSRWLAYLEEQLSRAHAEDANSASRVAFQA